MILRLLLLLFTVLNSHCMSKKRSTDIAFEKQNDEANKSSRKEQATEFLGILKHRSLQPAVELLDQGAFVNAQEDASGFTALHYAAQLDDMSGLNLLITRGADKNKLTADGKTPLQVALERGNKNAVQTLLVKGANSNHLPLDGEPLIHKAIKQGSLELVTLLVRWGANLKATNKEGHTALICARLHSNEAISSYLASEPQASALSTNSRHEMSVSQTSATHSNNQLSQELIAFFKKRSLARAKELLVADENLVRVQDEMGFTGLHYAAQNNDMSGIDWLIDRGADKDAFARNGLRPLECALALDNANGARMLVIKGASIGWTNGEGDTPLHIAVRKGNLHLVKLLLDKQHTLSCVNNAGLTPFLCAVKEGHEALVTHLLAFVDKKEATPEKRTALHLVAQHGQASLCELLLGAGFDGDALDDNLMTPLHHAARSGNEPVARSLIKHKVSVITTSKQCYSALHYAAEAGHVALVILLLENGALIEGRTNRGFTPLHLSAMHGKTGVSDVLIQRGALVETVNFEGQTAEFLAEKFELQHDNEEDY